MASQDASKNTSRRDVTNNMFSSIQTLSGELNKIKQDSDRYIHHTHNYIVAVHAKSTDVDLKPIAKEALYKNQNHIPVAVYCSPQLAFLMFSCVSTEHYLKGSHQSIISEYCAVFSKAGDVMCNIIETNSKTKLVFYVMFSMFSRFTRMMMEGSGGKLTEADIHQMTINEVKKVYIANGLVWMKKNPALRYGEIFKLKESQGTQVISSFAAKPDFRQYQKFIVAVFGEGNWD